jgi:hypothetical protein
MIVCYACKLEAQKLGLNPTFSTGWVKDQKTQ